MIDMPLPIKLFDTALSDEIQQHISDSTVAYALKDINYLQDHIQNTLDSNPTANDFIFTVWFQSEWVVITYNKTSKQYVAYTRLKLPFKNLTYRQPSESPLCHLFEVLLLIYKQIKTIDLETDITATFEYLDFSTPSLSSFKNFYILTDDSDKKYYLYEMLPGQWLNLVIQDNEFFIYGKNEVLNPSTIEAAKVKFRSFFANHPFNYHIVKQSSTMPSFLNALNNLVQIQQGIEPSPIISFKLIQAFSELACFAPSKNVNTSIDLEELLEKIDGIGITFDEASKKFKFQGQNIFVELIECAIDESQTEEETPIFLYYEKNPTEKFILAKKEACEKYGHLLTQYQSANIKWIKHDNDLDLNNYCYQVLSQLQDGKDCQLLDFVCDETSSINSSMYFDTHDDSNVGMNLTFFKPYQSPQNASSQAWISRDTVINSVLFGLGAAFIVAFALTMAGPALLIGLLLFAILAVRVIKPNPTIISPS